jgi:hypothetical protein
MTDARKTDPHTQSRKTEETAKTAWILALSHRVGWRANTGAVSLVFSVSLVFLVYLLS